MVSRFTALVIDCHEPKRLADFWCAVLEYRILDEDEDPDEIEIASWEPDSDSIRAGVVAPTLLFSRVSEGKTIKNRLHIDVNPIDRTRDAEVERLEALGARRIDIGQGEQSWVVMADPEDNEFCVLRSVQA